MRIGPQADLKSGRLQRRDRVGRRHFDPIDLARAQCREPCRRLRHWDQDHLFELRDPGLVPVIGVAGQFGELAEDDLGDLERPGTCRVLGELRPALARFLPFGRADDQNVGDQIWEKAERIFGVDRDRAVVDLLPVTEHVDERAHDRRPGRIELWGLLVIEPLQVPDNRVGGDRGAVGELDTLAQGENPAGVVARIDFPCGRQPWRQSGNLLGMGEIPIDQAIESSKAEEPISLAAIVRDAAGGWDVGRSHRNAKRLRKPRDACRESEQQRGGDDPGQS